MKGGGRVRRRQKCSLPATSLEPEAQSPLAPAGLGIRSMSVIAHFNTYR